MTTGALGHVPWNLLPSLRATPVVVAPSATSWVAASASQPGRPRRVVAVSGPDVPYASREVAEIGAVWATSAVTVDADRATLASGLSDATLLHVAAHGVHNTENALFSSVRMADGLLFAHELDAHERTPEHVVLSACEVGLATVRPGDEALGLTSVLLRLGTRSVVAGVARVADELAADAMVDYHRRLAAGADSATALAEATAKADGLVPFVCFGSGWRAT